MRKAICLILFAACELVLLAACELKPAPKQEPPAATPPPAARSAPAAPSLPTEVGSGAPAAGSAAPKAVISGPCLEVAAKIMQINLAAVTDPGQKRVLEQARANNTRKVGEACTSQAWSDAALACYQASKTVADLKACETKFSPPPAPQPPPPTDG